MVNSSLIADRGGGGGGVRGSPEFQNDVNAGGRGGTYHPQARGYERGYNQGMNQGYNQGSYNNNAGQPTYMQPAQPMYPAGPQINPDQEPY